MGNSPMQVLFVSPQDSLMEEFSKFKASQDWEIQTCTNSFSALQSLKKTDFEVVVMEREIGPLDPYKLMDYIFHELQKFPLMVIVGKDTETEGVHEHHLTFNLPMDQVKMDILYSKLGSSSTDKEQQLFSLDYLTELSDNDPVFLEESIVLFRDSLAVKLEELRKVIDASDFEEARQIAHNIKPTFAMLGNTKGRALCQSICYDANDSDIADMTKVLIHEYDLIVKAVEKQFPKIAHHEKENIDH